MLPYCKHGVGGGGGWVGGGGETGHGNAYNCQHTLLLIPSCSLRMLEHAASKLKLVEIMQLL